MKLNRCHHCHRYIWPWTAVLLVGVQPWSLAHKRCWIIFERGRQTGHEEPWLAARRAS